MEPLEKKRIYRPRIILPTAASRALIDQAKRFARLVDRQSMPWSSATITAERMSSFSQDLILCLSEKDVIALINKDWDAAFGFRLNFGNRVMAAASGEIEFAIPSGRDDTPFFLLASLFIDQTHRAKNRPRR